MLRSNGIVPDGSSSTLVIDGNDELHCAGDSGGPWMFNLFDGGTSIMVQYGVHDQDEWGGFVGGNVFEMYDVASAIPSSLQWIQATMTNRMYPSKDLVVTERLASGYKYRTYSERVMATLTVSFTGKGTLTSSPATFSCKASPCRFRFLPGTAASVTATPQIGYVFSSWTNCPSPSGNRCNVTMTADRSMSARLVANPACYVDDICLSDCAQQCIASGGSNCPSKCEIQCTICE